MWRNCGRSEDAGGRGRASVCQKPAIVPPAALQNLNPRAQPRERDVHKLLGQIVTGFVLQDSSSVLAGNAQTGGYE
jgi:hypothetical protein